MMTWTKERREAQSKRMEANNPMSNPEFRKKTSTTVRKKYKRHSKEAREKASKRSVGSKNNNWGNFGYKNPAWKGGLSPLNSLIRSSRAMDLWKLAIYSRDNFTCQECKSRRGGQLEAHHITPFIELIRKYNIKSLDEAYETDELWVANNGTTLCQKCHRKTIKKEHEFENRYRAFLTN